MTVLLWVGSIAPAAPASPTAPLLRRETVSANVPNMRWTRCLVYPDRVTVEVQHDGVTDALVTRPIRFTAELASADRLSALVAAARAATVSPKVPAPTDMADVRDDLVGPTGIPEVVLRHRSSGQQNLSEEGRSLVRFLDANCDGS